MLAKKILLNKEALIEKIQTTLDKITDLLQQRNKLSKWLHAYPDSEKFKDADNSLLQTALTVAEIVWSIEYEKK